ncbi:MAG TPA: N-acetylneuraminate synthase family protein [Bacteroidia bacterium]|jgi:spore coat polysaccharide biosynthesis protein SpsF (cytidylyltransferase family)/sialic acid synthase SpsE|nr:N-acetylneuraminate synthase family protein [Bacteroidia bacterium]
MKDLYNILEVANVHAGSEVYVMNLLDEFAEFRENFGIKFQPFKYDSIALPDFSWYEVYKELYFSPEQWKKIIAKAHTTKDVWIDFIDEYTFQIASDNLPAIKGFKFQASNLNNKKLILLFSTLNLSDKVIILNISGISIADIDKVKKEFEDILKPKEIILQIGFQSYPTLMEDSGLTKIETLQNHSTAPLSFADHIAPDSEDAYILPTIAALKGVTYLEKHICLSGEKPKYDFYSSMNITQYKKYTEVLTNYKKALEQPFINTKEEHYLTSSIQIPVLAKNTSAGTIPSLTLDFEFKRSGQTGLRANEIEGYAKSYHLLSQDKKQFETIKAEDFKKATIASIIACRLKSSRLPKKALLKIGELPSVERCIKSALAFKNVNQTILATSTETEDAELENHTYDTNVAFHKGHPLDVIQRYIDVIDKYRLDVIIRITADMPYVTNEVAELMLQSHFASGADFTRSTNATIGTGIEIINAHALKKIKTFFPAADYSEYMTFYFVNNPAHFKINEVTLPNELVRDYRLTLDYPEDLELFTKIQEHLDKNKLDVSLKNIYEYLDANPEIAKINKGMEVRYKTDTSLIEKLNKYTTIPHH